LRDPFQGGSHGKDRDATTEVDAAAASQ